MIAVKKLRMKAEQKRREAEKLDRDADKLVDGMEYSEDIDDEI